jgi:hypothetical protein
MAVIAKLSGQEYVDRYASTVKEQARSKAPEPE